MWPVLFGKKKITPIQSNGGQRFNLSVNNPSQVIYPSWDISHNADRYCKDDDIYSIIRRLANTSASVPSYVMVKRKEETQKRLFKELKNFKPTGNPLHQKALILKLLEDVPESNKLAQLLDNPSSTMGKFEFYEALYSLLYLHGEAIVYIETGPITGPKQLHLLYPQHVQLLVTQTFPQRIAGYRYSVDGQVVMEKIEPEEIIHIKYFNPHISAYGDELRGLSPIKALHDRLNRSDSNMQTSSAQLKNGGVPTILYDESLDMNEQAKEIMDARKASWYNFLRKIENAGSAYWATGKIGSVSTGLSNVDLAVMAIENVDFKKKCNAFGLSARLFNHDGTGSEISDDNAQRGLYTNGCIPQVLRVNEAFEAKLNPYYKGEEYVIQADFSEIRELQEDSLHLAQTFAALPFMIPNNILEALKYGRSEDPLMDKTYIKQGYSLLEDMVLPEPLDEPEL